MPSGSIDHASQAPTLVQDRERKVIPMSIPEFRTRVTAVMVAGAFACLAATPAHAQISDLQKKCFDGIAKASAKFVKARLKAVKKCKDAELSGKGCDTAKRDDALAKATTKLEQGLDKSCAFSAANFANMGFPGQCGDANPGDGFTTGDLKACIAQSHTAIADELVDVEYDPSLTPPLVAADLKCQKELSKNGQKVVDCVLKSVQKCRQGILKGKITGIAAEHCQTDDAKTAASVAKCTTKARDAIKKKCSDAQAVTLKACTPDQTLASDAADCVVDTHRRRTDSVEATDPTDLVDYEYADPGLCGDNQVNSLDEECDGTDDGACPGQCGTAEVPDGFFACLCKTNPRERVVEHSNADLDEGWSGVSHDGGVVEGGGYIGDLYDCDGSGNCIVGPNCSGGTHAPCATTRGAPLEDADAICAGLGQGTCRKERTATGPHCFKNIKQECDPKLAVNAVCNQPGDFCVKTFHGPPTPISSGGVPVCVVTVFSEDVRGTTNILTGATSIRWREDNITYTGLTLEKPCPVCGGFCAGNRDRCAVDADCGGAGPCVTAALCSDGPNAGKPCRATAPFGGPTLSFGTISVDCPPDQAADISNGGLDFLYNPMTTGQVTLLPSYPCNAPGFTGNACLGGSSEGRPCTTASECPGGTCTGQCFCPSVGGAQQRPNACDPACVGGANDKGPCVVDSECPSGFCHLADCRPDPSDTGSSGEGRCTTGPSDQYCADPEQYRGCTIATQAVDCPITGTCVAQNRQCFVNSGIVREGIVGSPERTVATVFCVPPTGSTSVDGVSGLPGPGAFTFRTRVTVVP